MNTFFESANMLKQELIDIRRSIHQCPEVGTTLSKTKEIVMDKLREYGYEPEEICESGIVAAIEGGKPGKTFLLRADMDALEIKEAYNPNQVYLSSQGIMASEDFASYTYEIPCSYLQLGAGTPQENEMYGKPMHNDHVIFNEDILPTGSAILVVSAIRWLEEHA